MQNYKNKLVAIVGLSVEGQDTVKFFASEGSEIWCLDRRSKEELGSIYDTLAARAAGFQLGEEYLQDLNRFDVVVRSPGISPRTEELVTYAKTGREVTSLTKLFFAECQAPIIGVTGTKGKGTTSTLISEILKSAGYHVWLGGNVGVPLLSAVRQIQKTDHVVLELSSFQLEDLHASPHVAVALNITQEHLANQDKLSSNFHESRDAYVEAKKSIVRHQAADDVAILLADDPTSSSFAKETKAKVFYFSRHDKSASAYVANHAVFLDVDGTAEEICTAKNIHLLGEHNLENIAAASLAAYVTGVPLTAMRETVKNFKGLPHRLEIAGSAGDIMYVNDSFSTVPETAIAAIKSFDKPIVLVAGGSEKGSDYTELGRVIAGANIRALILVGVMAKRIEEAALAGGYKGQIVKDAKNMHEIVSIAAGVAKPGDVVLLSPACASFGMFTNYKERGTQFKHEVSLL